MPVLDGPMGKLAKALTGTFGRTATLKRASTPNYNDDTGKTTTSQTSVTCNVVLSKFEQRQVDGTLVRQGDRIAIVSRLDLGSVEPKPNQDTLTIGSVIWQVVRVIGYSSGANEAAYELHLRR